MGKERRVLAVEAPLPPEKSSDEAEAQQWSRCGREVAGRRDCTVLFCKQLGRRVHSPFPRLFLAYSAEIWLTARWDRMNHEAM